MRNIMVLSPFEIDMSIEKYMGNSQGFIRYKTDCFVYISISLIFAKLQMETRQNYTYLYFTFNDTLNTFLLMVKVASEILSRQKQRCTDEDWSEVSCTLIRCRHFQATAVHKASRKQSSQLSMGKQTTGEDCDRMIKWKHKCQICWSFQNCYKTLQLCMWLIYALNTNITALNWYLNEEETPACRHSAKRGAG